jgi:TatA/E family protein of Tat protein translocase
MEGLFQPSHIILILVVALLIFGPKRLPDIGKSLGKGIREFKGALSHLGDDEPSTPPTPPPVPPPAQAVAPPVDGTPPLVVPTPAPPVPAPVETPPPPQA